MIAFEEKAHLYTSRDTEDKTEWLSVTTLVSQFKQPFDGPAIAKKSAKNRKSKWYGMTEQDILDTWKRESDRACSLGNWYHLQREMDLLSHETLGGLPIVASITEPETGRKIAPSQKLSPGIYPEHMVYLKSAGICGQSDLVTVTEDGLVNITDYKSNKEIKRESFKNWEGISQRLKSPISHLDDCNFWHYALQLSVYMYIILKHNPTLKPGTLVIHHVTFETEDQDAFGYPVLKTDANGDPIVKEIIPYGLPYLMSEVRSMLLWLQDNRHKIKKK